MQLHKRKQRTQSATGKPIDETTTKGHRSDNTRTEESQSDPLPDIVLLGRVEEFVNLPSTLRSFHLVVYNGLVDIVYLVEFSELETTRRLDKHRLRGLGLGITKRDNDDGWNMDELGIEFQDDRGGGELGFETMGWSTKGHQSLGQLQDELLSRQDI